MSMPLSKPNDSMSSINKNFDFLLANIQEDSSSEISESPDKKQTRELIINKQQYLA